MPMNQNEADNYRQAIQEATVVVQSMMQDVAAGASRIGKLLSEQIQKHPTPWTADYESDIPDRTGGPSDSWKQGEPGCPPSISDANGDLVLEMPAEEPPDELVEEWARIKAEHQGHDTDVFAEGFCQSCWIWEGGGLTPEERWREEEEARRYDNAKELVKWVNDVARIYG